MPHRELSSGHTNLSKEAKRASLCIDALGGPKVRFGATLTGWILAPVVTLLIFAILGWDGYRIEIISAIVCFLGPTAIAKGQPYLFTVIIRNLWFSRFYDA